MELIDRHAECGVLDGLLEAIRAGESRALVVSGEAGVGKTALLEYMSERASGCLLARATGVQSEMELPFAGLHQLCGPMLGNLPRLPPPQREALQIAFGMSAGSAPDRFLVGLAVLSLLSDTAEQQPLVCVVDDEHWLDRTSAQVLGFVARRLMAESVALIFAARIPSSELMGLPELAVEGLAESDARALLDTALTGPLDNRVLDRIVAETRGNPLALLELSRALTPQQLAGGFWLPGAVRLSGGVEEQFRQRIEALPAPTRRLLLIAAAEPLGDPDLLWRAAAQMGIDANAAAPAVEANLVEVDSRVKFRHPIVRSVVYGYALPQERREVHAALGDATDFQRDPDRRAWHLANAAPGPDEEVAEELERSAGRARARGGLAAAAAFLERATVLTLDSAQRTERALAAASANIKAGGFDAARALLSLAESGAPDDLQQARIDLMEAELALLTSRGSDAPSLLLKAARRLEPIDADLCRATYLQALASGYFAGRLATGGGVLEVARAAATAPPPRQPERASDLLLDGLVAHYNVGYAAGLPLIRKGLKAFGTGMPVDEELRWHWVAGIMARHVWDDESWHRLSDRHVQLARSVGALSELPVALNSRAFMLLFAGELPAAAALIQELQPAIETTATRLAPYPALGLAVLSGRAAEATALIDAITKDVTPRGEGIGLTVVDWANAVLNNGLGNYQEAMTAAERSTGYLREMTAPTWTMVELIEAAARSGHEDIAADALARLAETTSASGTDWGRGVEARSRALLSEADAAERLYREAIERLARRRVRADLARAHLVYGEWLRRERRRVDARTELRTALEMLESMGMDAFAERASRELQATGETARKRAVTTSDHGLTAQEWQVARLAREGLSNPEIGARLFISARTVQYHLRKVFAKLGINSRSQLDGVLPD
jgi:DNA-binding CsgD family transcriptional regulator/tetratricopeptide (TPR) repeat protein